MCVCVCVCVCVCLCVCVGGWLGEWVDVHTGVSVVSEYVCLLYPSIFIFSSSFCFLWFLVVFLLEMRMIYFVVLFVFVAVC